MIDSDDFYCVPQNSIHQNVGRAPDRKFAKALKLARPAYVAQALKFVCCEVDPAAHQLGVCVLQLRQPIVDSLKISDGPFKPFDAHG
jgi:hypothetical protein